MLVKAWPLWSIFKNRCLINNSVQPLHFIMRCQELVPTFTHVLYFAVVKSVESLLLQIRVHTRWLKNDLHINQEGGKKVNCKLLFIFLFIFLLFLLYYMHVRMTTVAGQESKLKVFGEELNCRYQFHGAIWKDDWELFGGVVSTEMRSDSEANWGAVLDVGWEGGGGGGQAIKAGPV